MKASQEALEARRRNLRARIAVQRAQLGQQMQHLEGPAHVFDRMRALGTKVYDHAGAFAVVASVALLLLRRPLLRSAVTGWRLARKLTRLLAFVKMATSFMRRHPASRELIFGRPATLKRIDVGSGAV